ncbi:hypothetical protein [Hominifimenecus sp. rT4P-3]|uniref:hypothetical protein n=1 Tax=Hominifimenecus sp. rT4P-3 TaxID=3242979 RepID=UPI003DA50984
MRVIEAFWEKRNLNVDTTEIEVEENDSFDDVKQCLQNVTSSYQVLKIPTGSVSCFEAAEQNGFVFREAMIQMAHSLRTIERPSVQQRLYDAVFVEPLMEEEQEELYAQIRDGMFEMDRISLDSYFKREQVAERYIGWIHDELKRGTELLKYRYKGDTIGFFGLREIRPGYYDSFLGGIYKAYRKGGIGMVIKVPEEVKRRGGKKLITSVSSNNVVQVRSLIQNGYIPEKIHYVYIKHCR